MPIGPLLSRSSNKPAPKLQANACLWRSIVEDKISKMITKSGDVPLMVKKGGEDA